MKNSKISILLLFLVMILAISAVSAADTNETSDSVAQAVDEAPVEEVASADVDTVASTDNTDVLSAGEQNFTQLQTDVDTGTVIMSNDYVRQAGENTVSITIDVTIEGNGHKIDADKLGGIFYVNSGCTLTLNGVTLINGNAENGGAIYNNGGTLYINNSYFLDNTATKSGGAIYNDGGSMDVIGSTFDGNDLTNRKTNGNGGAAIYTKDADVTISTSTISNNLKDIVHRGGTKTAYKGDLCSAAVSNYGGSLTVTDSIFENNSGCYGGAILSIGEDSSLVVSGSAFNNNFAFDGGAIYCPNGNYTITESNFTGNQARGTGSAKTNVAQGGAIAATESDDDCLISECIFKDNSAAFGGAISNTNAIVSNCTFINNTVDSTYSETFNGKANPSNAFGGAIYNNEAITISDSIFEDNVGLAGGLHLANAIIAGSSFTNSQIYTYVEIDDEGSYVGSLSMSNNTYDNDGSDIHIGNCNVYFDGVGDVPILSGNPHLYADADGFEQLQNLIDSLPTTGAALYLAADVSKLDSEYATFADGIIISKNTYIYAERHTITSDDGKVFTVNEGVTLNLRDADVVGDGTSAIVNNGVVTLYKNNPSTFTNVGDYAIENNGRVSESSLTTFTQLNDLIALVSGGEVNIASSKIIKADDEKDAFKEGIVIDKDLTIIGTSTTATYIDANDYGRIFNVTNGATLTLNKMILKNGNANNGGAVYVEDGAALITNTVNFIDNVAADNGGAIYTDGGEITLTNCVLDSNDVTNLESSALDNKGGAAIYAKDAQVTLVNTDVTNNGRRELDRSHGDMINAVINLINSNATITGGLFENNTGIYGGAIYAEGDGNQTLNVSGATFNSNKAYNGAAIDITSMMTNISGCEFNNNWVVGPGSSGYNGLGGAVASDGFGSFTLTNSNFTGNRATGANASGGAVSVGLKEDCAVVIDNCTFKENTAVSKGGAVIIGSNVASISNSTFSDDNVAEIGNDIYNAGNLKLSNNTIESDASGIYSTGGKIDTHVWVIVNDNKNVTVEYYDTIPIVLKITDDNGNLIRIDEPTIDIDLGGDRWTRYALTLDDSTGFYTMDNYLVDQKSGLLTPSRITLGKYFVSYNANTNLNSSYVTMIKANASMEVTYQNVSWPDDVVITINVTGKQGAPAISWYATANPPFKVTVNDKEYKVKITNGIGTLTIPDLPAGEYVINASWGGNTKYNPVEPITSILKVSKVNVTEFTVSPGGQGNRIPYGENVTVYVGLYGVNDEGLNETFTVIVNNTEYTVTVVNGTGSFNVSGLEPGDYSAQAIFDSNPNYNKAYASGVFSVLRPDRTLSIAVENVELGETAIVNITINKGDESDIGIVVLNINGTEYTVSVEGSVSFEIAGLPIGTHVINAILLADGLDDAVVNDTESITVGDDHEVTVAVIANETISYGENLTVEIGQIISSGLEKVVTGNATIYIYDGDDSTVEPVIAFPCNVGEDGVAVDFKGLSVGNYMIIVDFDSADGYYAGQATTYATVKQAKSSIVIKPIGEVTYGNDVTIEYTVLNATTIRINVATKDLKPVYYDTFDANVSEYSNSFVLPNLAAGEYIVVVENDGNDNYTFSSTSIEFTVNKAETTMQTEITPDIKVGDEGVVIKVVLPENATGKVMLSIDDEPVSQMGYELINGTANITVPADFVTAGKHSYYVSYDGDDNYTSAYDFKSFEVSKVTPAVNIVLNESEIGVAGSALVNITVAGDATGKLLIDNNGDLSIVELTNGNYTLPLYNLVAGEYYINVTYIGDDKYSGANASKVITVPKADVKIVYETVTPEIKYGESATVKVDINPDFATGNVTIFVDNIEYETVDLDEDYANATISIFGLAMGSHNITVTYNGDENYNNQTKFSQNAITVTKGQPTIEIMLDNDVIEVGSEISVIYGIFGEVNGGNITISIDGVECYNKPINGTVNYIDILSDLLTAGNHTISAQYLGDDLNLPSNIDKVNVTVLNMSEIKINIDTPENTTDLVFSVTLPSNATGYLFVDVDGQHYYAPVKNGTASVTVPSLAPGNYTAAITYSGDDQYDNVTLTKEVSVASNVPDNAFTIPDTAKDGEPLTYSINLPSDAKGYLEVDVDGKKYVAPLENGSASISVPGLSAGNHNVTVSYTGDGKYSPVTKSMAMNVSAPVYKITNNNNVAAIYSANANYKVLITKDGKAVGAGESVVITFNGKKTTVKTDSKGYATLKLNTKVKVKTYTVTAEYKGVKVSNKVTIKHVIKAKNVNVKKSKKVNKIKVKTNKVNGKFLKGKKLTLKIKGKKIKAKINKKGVATFKVKKSVLKKLKVGKKYKYTVTYGKDTVTKKLKVKR